MRPSLQDATPGRVRVVALYYASHNQDVQPDSCANIPNVRVTTSSAHPFDSPGRLNPCAACDVANPASVSAGNHALNNISDWDTVIVGEMILHNPNNISFPYHLPKKIERERKNGRYPLKEQIQVLPVDSWFKAF